ncbi:MAG: YkvA family protein [Cyclobacteriaceae bacterium]
MSVFQNLYKKAEEAVQNNDKINGLIYSAKAKMVKLKDNEDEIGTLIRQLNLMIRMVKAYFNGEYRSFSYKTIVMFVFSLVYFITPVDFIPDFIPGLGFTDDLSILYMVIKSFSQDIEKYQAYEDSLN